MIKKDEKTFLGINLSGNPERANYLARILAPFYEKLIEVWLKTKGFRSKGRPTVYDKKTGKYRTYDYTLEKNGKFYIVEAKCWLAFNNSDYLELKESLIEEWGDKDNFVFFCNLGTRRESYKRYNYKYKSNIDGTSDPFKEPIGKILIWPKLVKNEIKKIKKRYGFSDIFSIEDALNDMKHQRKKSREYFKLISIYRKWTRELFRALIK